MIWINCFPNCLWKVLGGNVKTSFNVSWRLCWATFSFNSSCTSTFVWLSAETLLTFQKRGGCQNCILHVQKKNIRRSSLKKSISKTAFLFESKSHRKHGNILWACVSNLHSDCWEYVSGGFIFWYKINSIILLLRCQKLYRTFDNNFLAVLSL